MLKALITRLLGRAEPVRAESPQDPTAALLSEVAASTEDPAGSGQSSPDQVASNSVATCRPGVLSSYAPVTLDDNPLAICEVRKTGPIAWAAQSQGWCINPSTSFPLTVVGTDEEMARQVREAMDGLVNHSHEDVSEAVAGLMVEHEGPTAGLPFGPGGGAGQA
jgi:hypothetical protein